MTFRTPPVSRFFSRDADTTANHCVHARLRSMFKMRRSTACARASFNLANSLFAASIPFRSFSACSRNSRSSSNRLRRARAAACRTWK